jgi:pyruvate/2-oxoglutarate dehydrogenase complex dihydrolipoamide acyltransferase (E2) component
MSAQSPATSSPKAVMIVLYVTVLLDLMQDAFYEKHGVKLGFMSAFVKAAASALQEVPAVNGVIDGQEIIYR